MQVVLPTMTFDHSLILYRQVENVEIFLARNAHTKRRRLRLSSREKVIVTGDALHGWTPLHGNRLSFDGSPR